MTTRKFSGPRRLTVIRGQQSSSADEQAIGAYGSGVRTQVFEVIVRQAIAGAPWQEICAGPMQVNNITPQEIIDELNKRTPPTPPAAAAGIPLPPMFKDYSRNRRRPIA